MVQHIPTFIACSTVHSLLKRILTHFLSSPGEFLLTAMKHDISKSVPRGQTKSVSSTTEAESYLRLAQTAGILSKGSGHSLSSAEMRTTTENYAMDSYQNLLFSIARFHEFTGRFPTKITIVGYEFKHRRFTELHRKAISWPRNKFYYVGVDPNHDGSGTNAIEGEVRLFLSSSNQITCRNSHDVCREQTATFHIASTYTGAILY